MTRKLIGYVIVIVLALFLFMSTILPSLLPNDLFHFIKINNKGYTNNVTVYLVSWLGCPFGASLSWPLYDTLTHFGNVSAEPHYSIDEADIGGYVPGLIFTGYEPNSTVSFHFIYLYNQYLNASPNGTSMKNLVSGGLEELKAYSPSWVYQIIYKYDVEDSDIFTGFSFVAPAYMGSPPHIPTTLIITGPNGTWILIGYLNQLSPSSLALSSNEGSINMNHLLSSPLVRNASTEINSIINESG